MRFSNICNQSVCEYKEVIKENLVTSAGPKTSVNIEIFYHLTSLLHICIINPILQTSFSTENYV